MALICLVLIGSLLGWLAAIVSRVEDAQGIRRDMAFGLGGALIAGLVANNGVVLGGLSWIALGAGIVGAAAAPAIYKFIQGRRTA